MSEWAGDCQFTFAIANQFINYQFDNNSKNWRPRFSEQLQASLCILWPALGIAKVRHQTKTLNLPIPSQVVMHRKP